MKTEQSNQFNKFKRFRKALYNWFVIPESLKASNPWQSIHVLTRRLRRMVIALLAIAIVGTGITVFIFFFPLRLPAWLPILRVLLVLFLSFVLLFIHFQQQGNRFYRQFLDEILNLNNNQQTLVIPRDKRKILRQFEWYSRGRILKINLIALGLASIFVLAPKKVINALKFRKQTVSKKLEESILKQHQQIAYLKTLNVQYKQIIIRLERNTQNNLSHIKRLKGGMHKHYRQIIELRRYLGQINRVRRQIQQLKKIGHAEVWKQERLIKSNAVVMSHIKGLTQAKLEFKEKPVNQADAILRKYGEVLKKFQELGVRYQKLERRTNNFSYRNSLEVKKAQKHINEDKAQKQLLTKEIDMHNQLIKRLQKSIQQDEEQLKKWQTREKLEREQVR